jgi:hypothetical protein
MYNPTMPARQAAMSPVANTPISQPITKRGLLRMAATISKTRLSTTGQHTAMTVVLYFKRRLERFLVSVHKIFGRRCPARRATPMYADSKIGVYQRASAAE